MINDYKIICSTWLTNAVKNAYYPISYISLLSQSNCEFVDQVLLANGQSEDQTYNKHIDIPKINIIETTKWDTNDLSQRCVEQQLKDILNYVSSLNENIILTIYCGDMVFTDQFRDELELNLMKLSDDDNYDFFRLPFAKVLTKKYRENIRHIPGEFYTYSAIKFDKKTKWTEIAEKETKLIGNKKNPQQMKVNWNSCPFSYETWFHSKEMLFEKAKNHFEWNSNWSLDEILGISLKKLSIHGKIEMKDKDHPIEIQPLLPILNEDHLGYSFFDRLL